AAEIDTTGMTRPCVIFNDASQARSEVLEVASGDGPMLAAVSVPACGYTTVDLAAPHAAPRIAVEVSDHALENDVLRVEWDADGLLTSVHDKQHAREVLAPGSRGNLFQLHDDNPKEFDAWNVDRDYLDHRVDLTALSSIEVIADAGLRGAVRFVR